MRKIDFSPKKPTSEINFTESTQYEIFDELGIIVSKGSSQKVDVAELDEGLYYLCYDNKMENFVKK